MGLLLLLLHLLNPGLHLLDGLLHLSDQGLLILQLAHQTRGVLLLALNSILQLLPGSLQLGDSLLHHLQLSLDLPALLLNVGSATLLLLIRALQLIKGGLKLVLDLVQVSHLVLGHLQVLLGLGSVLADVLLLLVELVDDLVLVGDLIIQSLDGVVTVGLLLLQLLDGNHDVINVLLDGNNLLLQDLLVLHGILASSLSLDQLLLGSSQLVLKISNLSGGLGLLLVVDRQVTLLLLQLSQQSLLLILDGLILLQESGLGVDLLLVLAIDSVGLLLQQPQLLLRVGHANERSGLLDDDEPSPLSHGHVLPEVALSNLDQLTLIPLLGVHLTSDSLEHLSLDETNPFDDQVITSLLKTSKSSGSEEDKSVSQPVSVSGEVDLVHESVDSSLVVVGAGNLSLSKTSISHLEVRVEHSVRETSHTDSDTLQHTITSQLVHDQWRLNLSRLLVSVGHKATDEVRSTIVQGGHQLIERDKVDRGDSLATTSLLLLLTLVLGSSSGLARMVFPKEDKQRTLGGGLEDLDNSVVDRILVLLKPVGDIVVDNTSVVRNTKVSILVSLGGRLQEDGKLAKGSLQLLLKGLVSGLGEERLLLKNSPQTHGLLKHDDGSLQVHTEVNHDPVNTFLDILLLLNNEHVVVEELLELLIDKVDGDLFESIVLEDLESGNIQDSAEVGLLERSINECVITLDNQPLEETIKDSSGNTSSGTSCLLNSLTLGHPLSSDLDPGLAESLEESIGINTTESSHLSSECVRSDLLQLSLVITTLLDVDDTSSSHDSSSEHVAVKLLLLSKSKNVEGILSVLKLLIVIDRGNSGLTLGDIDVVVDVAGDLALGSQSSLADSITIRLEQLVEDVVGSLNLLLLSDTRLLQQIRHDVATSQLTRGSEVDTDELSETGRVVISGGLGITIGLKNGVGGHNLVLKRDLLLRLLARASGDHGKVGDDLLGVLSLASTRLSSDQHGVVLLVGQHVPVGSLSNGPEMRRNLITSLAKIDLADSVSVQRITLVGVDNNHEETRVGMDHLGLVSGLQVPEDRSIIEEGQVDHVLNLLKLGRIDLANLSSLVGELLMSHGHNTLGGGILQVSRLNDSLSVSSRLRVRDPDRLLRIIGLGLVSSLHLNGGEQELCGIRVHSTLHQLDMARHGGSCDLSTSLKLSCSS